MIFLGNVLQRGLLGRALRQEVEQSVTGLGIVAVNNDFIVLALHPLIDNAENGFTVIMVDIMLNGEVGVRQERHPQRLQALRVGTPSTLRAHTHREALA